MLENKICLESGLFESYRVNVNPFFEARSSSANTTLIKLSILNGDVTKPCIAFLLALIEPIGIPFLKTGAKIKTLLSSFLSF